MNSKAVKFKKISEFFKILKFSAILKFVETLTLWKRILKILKDLKLVIFLEILNGYLKIPSSFKNFVKLQTLEAVPYSEKLQCPKTRKNFRNPDP